MAQTPQEFSPVPNYLAGHGKGNQYAVAALKHTRLTNAFSKRVESLKAAVSLHFAHYNFVRLHRSTRITPAMAAGVSDRLWTLGELIEQTSR